MIPAPLPSNESQRLSALYRLHVLDCAPQDELDALAQAAALACDMPISLISLVDADRQWFLAQHGLPGPRQTPRDVSFCSHAILDHELFEIPDARLDERFADNPLVTGAPGIRYYGGVPLQLDDGQRVGTLCVVDRQPRTLTPTQRRILQLLARLASRALEDRRATVTERQLKEDAERAREQLARSEARFRAVCEASPLGVFLTDPAGACVYTNDRWQELYGLGFEDSLGERWAAALHADDRPAVFAAWQQAALSGDDFSMEFRICRADGSLRHVHARARPVHDGSGLVSGFAGTVEDVTARNQMQEALRQSEQLLKRTGEVAGVGGWILDIRSGAVGWSAEASRIFGLPADAAPDLEQLIALFAPAVQPVVRAVLERARSDGRSWDLELPLAGKGRRQRWVRAVGDFDRGGPHNARLIGAFEDITLRVEQRRLLSAANERIALATDSGGIGIWDLDLRTGDMMWDACMFRLYGLTDSPWPVAREEWLASVHEDDRSALEQQLAAMACGASATLETEFRIITPDHALRHLRAAARLMGEADGPPRRIVGVSWDITPLRELGSELAEQHELMRVTLHSIGDAVITTDAGGKVAWINPVAESLTGWRNEDAVGAALEQVFALGDTGTGPARTDLFTRCLERGQPLALAGATTLQSRDGQQRGVEASLAPIRSEGGQFLGAVLVFHDVTEQRRLAGEVHYRACHDALTGLVNRAEFEQRLERLLQQAREDGSQHALLFVDLDHFKQVNDSCGHAAGDRLLQQIARLLTESVRSRDTLARLGGDEFALLLERCPLAQAERVGTTICRRMDDFVFLHEGQSFRLGASIGLVPLDGRWPGLPALVEAADSCCYAAKESGRNRVQTWQEEDAGRVRAQGQWNERIERALEQGGFELYAQTIHAFAAEEVGMQVEILLRMRGDDGALILPGAFMPLAERFHLSARIDLWVVNATLEHLRQLPALDAIAMVCINLSGQSIADRTAQHDILQCLGEAGPRLCSCLCFEIGEAVVVSHPTDCRHFIEQLHRLGARVALDDFGTGSSTFGYLRGIDVDLLKIDGSIVRDMLEDPLDAVAVRCFVEVASVVGVGTVAKLVERQELVEHLRAAGIDHVQGMQLHAPQPLAVVLPC